MKKLIVLMVSFTIASAGVYAQTAKNTDSKSMQKNEAKDERPSHQKQTPESKADKWLIGEGVADDGMDLIHELLSRDFTRVELSLQGFDLCSLLVGELGLYAPEATASLADGRRELLKCVNDIADGNLI